MLRREDRTPRARAAHICALRLMLLMLFAAFVFSLRARYCFMFDAAMPRRLLMLPCMILMPDILFNFLLPPITLRFHTRRCFSLSADTSTLLRFYQDAILHVTLMLRC